MKLLRPWTSRVPAKATRGTSRVSPGYLFDGAGEPGSIEESDLLKQLMGPGFGVPATEVSDLSVLLVAPMARGAEVSLR